MPRIIWSRPGNPTRGVATALGITLPQLGDAIHAIKKNARLRAHDNVSIGDDGSVTDARDESIGNITTKLKTGTLVTNAGLNFAGDRLEPDRISALFGIEPTLGYRKGEIFKRSRGHEIRGRTGLWRLTTRRQLDSAELSEHLAYLLEVLFPGGSKKFIEPLRALMREFDLEAEVDTFWYGEQGATPPVIPEETRAAFAQIGATIEIDFATD